MLSATVEHLDIDNTSYFLLRTENEQSYTENEQSYTENEQSYTENEQSYTENEQSYTGYRFAYCQIVGMTSVCCQVRVRQYI